MKKVIIYFISGIVLFALAAFFHFVLDSDAFYEGALIGIVAAFVAMCW